MKAVRLSDLRELLQGQPFAAWWTDYLRALEAAREAVRRHEDLEAQAELMEVRSELAQRAGIDTFSRAGEAEDGGAKTSADAQAHENRALELVGHFEDQRLRTSALWVRLGGAEKAVEERRDAVANGGAEARNGARARAQAEAALKTAEQQHAALQDEYAAEDRKRARLWDEVEAAWGRSFERSLLAAEHGLTARRIRREAERLFKEAEDRRGRARQLRGEAETAARELAAAEKHRVDLLTAAGERFGCLPGDAFLYWRHPDEKRAAFAVALADGVDAAGAELKALSIHTVGAARGAAALEPAREGLALTVEEGDRRFEEYLLGPRRGGRRTGGPGGAGTP